MSFSNPAGCTSESKIIHLRDDSRHVLSEGTPCRCDKCNARYILPWVASTIRDGREKICPDCYLDEINPIRALSLLGGRPCIGGESAPLDFPVLPVFSTFPLGGG